MSKTTEFHIKEFGVAEVIGFFRQSGMLIAWSTAIGIMGAAVFLVITPRQYESTASFQIAQVLRDLDQDTTVGIETPSMLIERLKTPSTYPAEVLQSCGLAQGKSAEMLVTAMTVSAPRDLTSVVKVTLRRPGAKLAEQCVMGIFEMIRGQHMAMLKTSQDMLQGDLGRYQNRLKGYQESMNKMEKTGGSYLTAYLVAREAVLHLMNKIDNIERIKTNATPTRLISPVYIKADPVYPKRGPIIVLGILAGSLLGFFVALGRAILRTGARQV